MELANSFIAKWFSDIKFLSPTRLFQNNEQSFPYLPFLSPCYLAFLFPTIERPTHLPYNPSSTTEPLLPPHFRHFILSQMHKLYINRRSQKNRPTDEHRTQQTHWQIWQNRKPRNFQPKHRKLRERCATWYFFIFCFRKKFAPLKLTNRLIKWTE